jgi:hypothetical protein
MGMEIEAKKFTLVMNYEELWYTALDVRRSLYNNIRTHWVHQQSDWEYNERERLARCKTMFYALGRPDLYDDIFSEAKDIFSEFKEKSSK